MNFNKGENNHLQYSLNNNDNRELFTQIYSSLSRNDLKKRYELSLNFKKLLQNLFNKRNDENNNLLVLSYLLIAYTRDINNGMGEYRNAYTLLKAWSEFFSSKPEFMNSIKLMSQCFINYKTDKNTSLGSFKDFKYYAHEFCLHLEYENYINNTTSDTTSDSSDTISDTISREISIEKIENIPNLIYKYEDKLMKDVAFMTMLDLYNNQLIIDYSKYIDTKIELPLSLSLAAKWAPRETKNKKERRFSYLSNILAKHMFPFYFKKTMEVNSFIRAEKKALMNYRKMISNLNELLNTVQVKQCNGEWSEINFDKDVTSITLHRQMKAFQNSKINESIDRIQCAINFNDYINKVKKNKTEIKTKCVSVADYVNKAFKLSLIDYDNLPINEKDEIDILNKSWEENSKLTGNLKHFIAMVDTSASMDGYPMNAAIGLGIRISEKSLLRNRIMTFSAYPEWIQFEENEKFTDKVLKVRDSNWGINTNFYAALNLIYEACNSSKISKEDISQLTLVILSDMQMDLAIETEDSSQEKTLDKNIEKKFYDLGMKICGEPYPTPKIIYWNLRNSEGFPTTSHNSNTIMISSGSVSYLNSFCEKGTSILEDINPFKFINLQLKQQKYDILKQEILNNI